ncbi:MAG: thiamine phosphate synthase [Desulfofustis sp.]|nr:thiamine phosphate synthase [Desulfofustis sp.]
MIDFSLYLVTDRSLSKGRSNRDIVEAAVAGGVTCVQLREKHCGTREFIHEALALRPLLRDRRIPLIINDRLDIALAVEADGVHLGQSDMPLAMARKIAGSSLIIGISAESTDDALKAEQEGADYIGISPVFSTPTKTDTAAPLDLGGVNKICGLVDIPLVGIGGINRYNAASVIGAGADGVAVVSAIVSADDPTDATRTLKTLVEQALAKKG